MQYRIIGDTMPAVEVLFDAPNVFGRIAFYGDV